MNEGMTLVHTGDFLLCSVTEMWQSTASNISIAAKVALFSTGFPL